MQYTGYLGSYLSPACAQICRFTLDAESGALSQPTPLLDAPDSKYLAMGADGLLASIVRRTDGAGVYLADLHTGRTAEALTESISGCHVSCSGNAIYSANFHEGTVSVYTVADGAPALTQRIEIAPGAGCHQVIQHERFLLVPCMELDEIRIFDAENGFAPAGAIPFPAGSGPRHGVFDRAHRRLFVAAQKDNALYTFEVRADGGFLPAGRTPLLPPDTPSGSEAAAIRLSADERFLYVSVRGANRIAVLALDGTSARVVQLTPCGGDHPRDITLSPDERHLLAANRYSNNLVCFPVDPATGRLGAACANVTAHQSVSILFDAPEKG